MAEFVLQPARLRETKFASVRDAEPVTMDWLTLRDRFAPSRSKSALNLLRQLKPGTFVGTRDRGNKITTFILDAMGKSRDIGRFIQRDPALPHEVVEVFLVVSATWDVVFEEDDKARPRVRSA